MDQQKHHKKVLVAPLDWGLGHATRCIPVIRYFLQRNWLVTIACPPGSAHQALLQMEFPQASFVPLPGYGVQYAHSRKFFIGKMLWQVPKILGKIRQERHWLRRYVASEHPDLIFSDNRYGLSHPEVPCIFMTHQLDIILPNMFLQRNAQRMYYRYINRFRQCWVPDYDGQGLAGILSHPSVLPEIPVYYIGPLSRLGEPMVADPAYLFLIVLSGPEPQRTIMEEKMLAIAGKLPGKLLLVRGLPHRNSLPEVPGNCTAVNHLGNEDMRKAFAVSQYIISRSGYTTVMEILSWQKKSILIPTPGQTEQEYLAKALMQSHQAYCFEQEERDYLLHFLEAMRFEYRFHEGTVLYEAVISQALADLKV